jgi:co-chaperonin GroES (HSP10)
MSKINYVPRGTGFLIKVEEQTKNGVILPDSISNEVTEDWYEVLKVGNKCEEVKVGDKVNFVNHCSPIAVVIDNKKYLVLQERDILGFYE